MTTTHDHPTYQHGSLSTWRLIKKSDGTRGSQGGHKQYIVRIELMRNGNFLVRKFWGKADGQLLSELSKDVVGEYDNYHTAYQWAYAVVRAKLDKGYWHDYSKHVELVSV